MNKTTITTLVVSALVGFAAHAQNLILNGSFESPAISANSHSQITPTSWQWTNNSPIGEIFNGSSGPFPLPEDGQQYVGLGVWGNGTHDALTQAFTVLNPGNYALNWFDLGQPGNPTVPYSVAVLANAAQVVASTNLDAHHDTPVWVSRSMQLTLSSGTYTLMFRSETFPSGPDAIIDNVLLQPVSDNSDLLASIHFSAVDICWPGRTNQMYQVQYRTNLSDTNWFDSGSPVLGKATNCVTDGINGMEQRFYRITRVP